jgi:hypothetical protein
MNRMRLITFCVLTSSAMLIAQTRNQGASKPGVRPASVNICTSSPTLVPDGTTSGVEDSIGAGAVGYYYENFDGGHSYSVEVWDPFDAYNVSVLSLALLDDNCNSGPGYQDVTSITPNLVNANADRISWIQPSDGPQQIGLSNLDTVRAYSYYIRISDTTLINPRWSTYSGFQTQYGFVNNTNSAISGTLTLTDTSGRKFTENLTLASRSTSFVIFPSSGFNVPTQDAGSATFAFVGPAGGITADAFFLNGNATVVVPSSFAPQTNQH